MRKNTDSINENVLSSNISSDDSKKSLQCVSAKAILVGIGILVLLSMLLPYAGLTGMIPSIDTETVPSPAGMAGIFLLLLINLIFAKLGKRFNFNQAELVTIYAMVMIGGLMMNRGLVAYQIVNIMAIPLFAISNSPSFYNPILDRIHDITTPKSMETVSGFWRGGADSVPWDEWVGPIIFWVVVFSVFYFMMMCVATLFRRRWTDYEHLSYPLVTPIINMTKIEKSDAGLPSFWSNRLMLIGAIWPVVASIMNTINLHVPSVPAFPIGYPIYTILATLSEPWNELGAWPFTWIAVQPLQVGVGYLLSTQITLSMWFFYVLQRLSIVFMNMAGFPTYNGLQLDQQRGAYIAIAFTCLWLARHEIKSIVKKAFYQDRGDEVDDSNEPLSFPMAFWGLIGGLIIVVFALQYFIGMSIWVSLMTIIICYSIIIGFARIRAEAGFLYSWASPNYMGGQITKMFGKTILGNHNTTTLGYFTPFDYGHFSSGAAMLLEGYKLGDLTGIKRRSMNKALFLAFFVAIIAGYRMSLPIIYEHGMFNLDDVRYSHAASGNIFNWATRTIDVMPEVVTMHGVGLVIAQFLAFMQIRFVWWPFSPLGFILAQGVYMNTLASNAFAAWLVKTLIYRYGGHQLYKKLLPLFLGFITGSVVMSVVSSVVSIIIRLVAG